MKNKYTKYSEINTKEWSRLNMFWIKDRLEAGENNLTLLLNETAERYNFTSVIPNDIIIDWKAIQGKDFLDIPNKAFDISAFDDKTKQINHYMLSRISGYLFEYVVIDRLQLLTSSPSEDRFNKIDAWDVEGNSYSITKKAMSTIYKKQKGDFEKMKTKTAPGKKCYIIFIDFNNQITMKETKDI